VRQQVPDAELHVYYGFDNWEPFASDAQKLTIAHLKKMLRDHEQHGVVYHGRVPQEQLAIDFLKSGVWCYPTWFAETSCITAMEAHAAGLRMVTNPIAALNETVGDRGVLIAGDWLAEDFKGRFTQAVIEALLREGDGDRIMLQHYAAEHFSWGGVALEWEEMFRQGMDAALDISLPMYEAAQ
jgi:glycosyltransferase involved in cell wall biosynthesis